MEIISTKVGKTRVIVWFAISLSVPLQVVRINSNAQPRFQVIRLSAISTVTLIKRNVTVTILPSNIEQNIPYLLFFVVLTRDFRIHRSSCGCTIKPKQKVQAISPH